MSNKKLTIERKQKVSKPKNIGKTAVWVSLKDHAWLMDVASLTGLSCGDIVSRIIAFAEPHMEIVGEPLRFKVQEARQKNA